MGLLTIVLKADYFRQRLQNEAWSKRITDKQAQFPEVHSMLIQFLKPKYRTFRPRGGVQVRGVDIVNCSLERSTSFVYTERVLNFSVLNYRSVPRVKPSSLPDPLSLADCRGVALHGFPLSVRKLHPRQSQKDLLRLNMPDPLLSLGRRHKLKATQVVLV